MKKITDYIKNKLNSQKTTNSIEAKSEIEKDDTLKLNIPTSLYVLPVMDFKQKPIKVPQANMSAAIANISLEEADLLDQRIDRLSKAFVEIPDTGHIIINSTINKIPEKEFNSQVRNIIKHGKKPHYTEIAKQVVQNMNELRELNKNPNMNNYTTLVLQERVNQQTNTHLTQRIDSISR